MIADGMADFKSRGFRRRCIKDDGYQSGDVVSDMMSGCRDRLFRTGGAA